jgi:hypothetical protein
MAYRSLFRRAASIAAPILLLTACSEPAETDAPAPTAESTEPAPIPVAEAPAPEPDEQPPTEEPRFVGMWAADERMCADKAWRFAETSLTTPAGSVCQFTKVTPAAGGYDIAARCTAEGPETEDTLEIRFAESAEAMLFESDVIADAGLIECG